MIGVGWQLSRWTGADSVLWALMVPYGIGRYDLGLFHTNSGPLSIHPALEGSPVPIRFNSQPEIMVSEV